MPKGAFPFLQYHIFVLGEECNYKDDITSSRKMTVEQFRELCLTLPDAKEQMHFDKPSYRWKGKIFATLHLDTKRVVLKFNAEQQIKFGERDSKTFYAVQGGWGKQGYTYVEFQRVKKKDIEEAVKISFANVSAKKPAKKK